MALGNPRSAVSTMEAFQRIGNLLLQKRSETRNLRNLGWVIRYQCLGLFEEARGIATFSLESGIGGLVVEASGCGQAVNFKQVGAQVLKISSHQVRVVNPIATPGHAFQCDVANRGSYTQHDQADQKRSVSCSGARQERRHSLPRGVGGLHGELVCLGMLSLTASPHLTSYCFSAFVRIIE